MLGIIGKGVLELVGDDVEAVCDNLIRGSRTCVNLHQDALGGEAGSNDLLAGGGQGVVR
ncbi:hypothetical protein ACIQMJ_39240 [Actinosynnema sp. NPDC091369]